MYVHVQVRDVSLSLMTAEPPVFIMRPQPEVKVAEGQDVELACAVFGAPKPRVTWFKNDQVVEGGRFSVDVTGKIVGNLTISVSGVVIGLFTSLTSFYMYITKYHSDACHLNKPVPS